MHGISEQAVLTMILERGGYARSRDLRAAGVHPGMLPALARSGRLVCIKRGFYALPDNEKADDRFEALMAIPGSVLCLGSALSIHEIGTWEPPEIYLAVEAGRKVTVPEFLPIRLFHFAKGSFELGIITKSGQGGRLRVYDAERTMCDLFRLKNLVGGDIAAEALREYLKHKERRIPRLLEYAEKLRVLGPIKKSLEVLL
jgi:predicted transcriptional regulator of viral defense system